MSDKLLDFLVICKRIDLCHKISIILVNIHYKAKFNCKHKTCSNTYDCPKQTICT